MASDEDQDGGMKLPTGGRVLAALEGGAQVEERRWSRKGVPRAAFRGLPLRGKKGSRAGQSPAQGQRGSRPRPGGLPASLAAFPCCFLSFSAQERLGFSFVEAEGGSGGEAVAFRGLWAASREPQSAPALSPKSLKVKPLHPTCHLTVDGFPLFLFFLSFDHVRFRGTV